ncbi:MAG: co-chaperone GroES family protein [Pseudomonadota bacterium]|jgi:co-chaperonin GroES (HSP10)
MSNRDRKKSPYSLDDSEHDESSSGQPTFEDNDGREGRRIRRLHPLGFRVVARVVRESNVTDGGLYLPEGAKENMQESVLAQVIEVASAVDSRTEEETNVSGIPLGSLVLIPKQQGVKVDQNGAAG